MARKKALCLDFDGVIHSYSSRFERPWIIPDDPVPGAFEFLLEAREHFVLYVYSTRNHAKGGISAMKKWFAKHGWPLDKEGEPEGLNFPTGKPPAHVYLDDRAVTFTGTWPEVDTLLKFTPWTKQG